MQKWLFLGTVAAVIIVTALLIRFNSRSNGLDTAKFAAARELGMVFSDDSRTLLRCQDKRITTANIPAGVISVNHAVFSLCGELTAVTIPESVKFIGDEAFLLCEKLENITIPDGVETIGKMAFWHSGLKTVSIPARFSDDDVKQWLLPAGCRIIRR